MKKTLIALATLAAVSGTAFAQSTVTLSGKARFAYESTSSTTGAVDTKANGLRVTDGDFALTAMEDLGGGLKATAFMNVQSRGRDTDIAARDAYLSLAGGFGSVMIGSIEAGNGIIGLGGAGAPVYGMDGSVIAGAGNVDIIKYTLPSFNGFTLSVNATDATASKTVSTSLVSTTVLNTLGMGSTAQTQDTTGFGVNYANGPLAVAADLTNYGANAAVAAAGKALGDSRTRISASYDLGVAKLGLGHQVAKVVGGIKTKDMIMGVSVPVGAFVLGANYATSQTDGGLKVKGYDLGAQYNLSKRTYVAAHYQSVDNKDAASTAAIADANSNNKFRVQLSHAF